LKFEANNAKIIDFLFFCSVICKNSTYNLCQISPILKNVFLTQKRAFKDVFLFGWKKMHSKNKNAAAQVIEKVLFNFL